MKKIKTLNDMIAYLDAIPAVKWQVDDREKDEDGRCCVLGHLDALVGDQDDFIKTADLVERLGVDNLHLAAVNNGTTDVTGKPEYFGIKRRNRHNPEGIKARVMNYLRGLQNAKA